MKKSLKWAAQELLSLRAYLGTGKPSVAGIETTRNVLNDAIPVIEEVVEALDKIAGALVVAGLEFGPGGGHVRPEFFKLTAGQIRSVVGKE